NIGLNIAAPNTVRIRIHNPHFDVDYNGTNAFDAPPPHWFNVTYTSQTAIAGTWSYSTVGIPFSPDYTYDIMARAVDSGGNPQLIWSTHTWKYDVTAPASIIQSPVSVPGYYRSAPAISGTAADSTSGSGLGSLHITIQD